MGKGNTPGSIQATIEQSTCAASTRSEPWGPRQPSRGPELRSLAGLRRQRLSGSGMEFVGDLRILVCDSQTQFGTSASTWSPTTRLCAITLV